MADMLFAMAVMTANIVTSEKMPPDKALSVLAAYAELVHRLLREKDRRKLVERMTSIDAAARAAYLACMASYAEMTPLHSPLAGIVTEPSWDALPDDIKEHWRRIARAVLACRDDGVGE